MNWLLSPLTWLIEWFQTVTGSYAAAIVLFTLAVKLCLTPLDFKQRNSMRRMNALQPQIEKINERYANDPDKRAQKTMALYKKEKCSPFASCLPMLIQLPILFAMVSVMNRLAYDGIMRMFLDAYESGTVQLENFLWVHNIFQPDNFSAAVLPSLEEILPQLQRYSSKIITPESLALFEANYTQVIQPTLDAFAGYANGWGFLPVLSGALQFLQTKLMPSAPAADPKTSQNTKMMNYMFPIMSVIFCWSFNAAFALYWVASSLLGIAQNLLINYYFKRKDAKEAEGVLIS